MTYCTLSSRYFFIGILSYFIFQATWIAISGAYPLFYDEAYHLSFIKVYSEQISPFISNQDISTAFLGDVTRTPSYFYHYLLSFPYRWSAMFMPEFYHQVVFMRFINIAFVVAGLILYSKVFEYIKLSKFTSNVILSIVILIPAFTFVAAHINYDNLLFLITSGVMLTLIKLVKNPSGTRLILLFALLGLGSLVKYTFLIIAVIVVGWLVYWMIRNKNSKAPPGRLIIQSLKSYPKYVLLLLMLVLVLVSGLVLERIAYNTIHYFSPAPSCSKVQLVEFCEVVPNLARYERLKQAAELKPEESVSTYAGLWTGAIMDSLFSQFDNGRGNRFTQVHPMPLLNFMVWTLFLIGIVLFIRHFPKIREQLRGNEILILAPLLYLLAIFTYNYATYRDLHVPAAVQGRYLIIILPLIVMLLIISFQKSKFLLRYHLVLIIIVLSILFLQGGLLSYIVSSDSSWYEDKAKVRKINETSRVLLPNLIYK